jgi:hypothetical protein
MCDNLLYYTKYCIGVRLAESHPELSFYCGIGLAVILVIVAISYILDL